MQGGGCGPAAAYYGAPCGGQFRVGQPGQPVVGSGAYQMGARRGLGSPEERQYLGSPEERMRMATVGACGPSVGACGTPYVGQRGGGHGGGGHGGGGFGHGGFGHGGGRGVGWWGNWGWPYAGYALDPYAYVDYGYGGGEHCYYVQQQGRWVCYVWDRTRGGWVVVG